MGEDRLGKNDSLTREGFKESRVRGFKGKSLNLKVTLKSGLNEEKNKIRKGSTLTESLLYALEGPSGIIQDRLAQLIQGNAPKPGHMIGRMDEIAWLVSLSPKRMRGQIRGIGFKEQGFDGGLANDFFQDRAFFIGDRPGDGQKKIQVQALFGPFPNRRKSNGIPRRFLRPFLLFKIVSTSLWASRS